MKSMKRIAVSILAITIFGLVACGEKSNKKLRLSKNAKKADSKNKAGANSLSKNSATKDIKSANDVKVLNKTLRIGESQVHKAFVYKQANQRMSLVHMNVRVSCVETLEDAINNHMARPALFVPQGSTIFLIRQLEDEMKSLAKANKSKNSATANQQVSVEPLLALTCGSTSATSLKYLQDKITDAEMAKTRNIYFDIFDPTQLIDSTLLKEDGSQHMTAAFLCVRDLDKAKEEVAGKSTYAIMVAEGSDMAFSKVSDASVKAASKAAGSEGVTQKMAPMSYINCNAPKARLPLKFETKAPKADGEKPGSQTPEADPREAPTPPAETPEKGANEPTASASETETPAADERKVDAPSEPQGSKPAVAEPTEETPTQETTESESRPDSDEEFE